MKKIIACTHLTLTLLASATVSFADNHGKAIVDTCLGCHGVPSYTNVYPTYYVPKLAGQHKEYLVAALKAYQSGERGHKTMHAQAVKLSDDDINMVAEFFSKQPSPQPNPNVKPPQSLEQQLATCAACHSTDGNSPVPTFPKIAGQREDYLYYSLKSYQTGERKNPIMIGIVAALKDDDMKRLSRYFASNPGLGVISVSRTAQQ